MSPAAALLRRLDAEAWRTLCGEPAAVLVPVPGRLLPLLAGLVEAVERADRESFGRHYRDDSNLAAVFRAFGALEAAAAKEGAK